MTALEVHQGNGIDRDAVLRAVGINVRDPNAQALLLICQKYDLDPVMKHVVLIQGRPYVTRDGYLHIAHESKALDGIEIVEEGEDDDHWWARVAVYRKDMGRPFAYKGRYPKAGSNKAYGPEMAIKCAEVAALRRAFNVTGIGAADEAWDQGEPVEIVEPPAPMAEIDRLRERVDSLGGGDHAQAFAAWKADRGFDWPWSQTAVDAMHAKLDEIAGTGANADSPTPGAGTDGEGGGLSQAPAESASSSPLPASDEEQELASRPCELCGSKRAGRTVVGGKVRCQNATECEKRAKEPM